MSKQNKNILIAYLPSKRDLGIAQYKNWYRIPVSSQNVPKIVKDKSIEMIAFYQPKIFNEDAHLIRYYGIVKSVRIVKRKFLMKDEPINFKSEDRYYKIQFEKLLRLPKSIISCGRRRILFITTTLDRFHNAEELNDLFLESPIEEKCWDEFKRLGIYAERQYFETIGNKNFILDFALFCKNRKLGVECDGDTYHTEKSQVQNDKRRDNLLESRGWNILRYTTNDIEEHFNESINQVKETVNQYGGLLDANDSSKFRYFPEESNEPTLFDEIGNKT